MGCFLSNNEYWQKFLCGHFLLTADRPENSCKLPLASIKINKFESFEHSLLLTQSLNFALQNILSVLMLSSQWLKWDKRLQVSEGAKFKLVRLLIHLQYVVLNLILNL